MVVELKPETERLLQEELSKGHFQSVDEIILLGIKAKAIKRSEPAEQYQIRRDAANRMLSARERVNLPPGETIKQWIEEGRD